MIRFVGFLCVAVLMGCSSELTIPIERPSDVPANFPAVPVPADNPQNPAKIRLGHFLFFEKRLSRDSTIACATCHQPAKAFTDSPFIESVGFRGERGNRNAPSILNAAYNPLQFWDGRAASLEEQAMGAFMNAIEMAADTNAVTQFLRREYADLWIEAFGDTVVTAHRAMQAISSWERSFIIGNSRYDRYVRGEKSVLTQQEIDGMNLFFSDRTSCSSCHSGVNFTDGQFYNLGLFHHYTDRGRYVVTRKITDESKFKTPGLRNVELTQPYMATGDGDEGTFSSLDLVVKHYNDGGSPFATKDKRIRKLGLSDYEQRALVAFMKSLTDTSYLTDPRYMEVHR